MSFDAQEISREGSAPIEIYDFQMGVDRFTYCTAPGVITLSGVTYEPLAISRSDISNGQDERTQPLTVTLPANNSLVRRYINGVPGLTCTLRIERLQRYDSLEERVVQFDGKVSAVAFTNDGIVAEVSLLPLSGLLDRTVPRFVYSALCNHVLFDDGCKVSSSLHRYVGLVDASSGDTLTISGLSAKGDGWANGGFVATPLGDYRLVIQHVGDDVRLLLPFLQAPLGQTVEVFAGCNHSVSHCGPKFVNIPNYGGYPYIPTKNPFQSGVD